MSLWFEMVLYLKVQNATRLIHLGTLKFIALHSKKHYGKKICHSFRGDICNTYRQLKSSTQNI